MWRTEYGDRILESKEATLFAEALLSLLEEAYLNDYDDYDDEDLYADRSPEEAQALRQWAGIDEGYYQSVAEDLEDEEIESKRAELGRLCRSFIEKGDLRRGS